MIVNKIINNLNKPVDKGVIENNINRLLSKDIDKRVGLVYGKVQSGKTNSIICLTGELIDRDYRLIILLISDLTELLDQNFDRILKSYTNVFKNYPEDIVIFKTTENDFKDLKNDDLESYFKNEKSVILCGLKNHTHLKNILNLINNSSFLSCKSIIIDDEGDDISQNTSKNKIHKGVEVMRSTVNKKIVELKELLNCGIISITATPQANLLLETIQSLSPDYCSYFEPSQNYTGLDIFHGSNSIIEIVEEDTDNIYKPGGGVPKSIRKALNFYIVSSSVLKFFHNKHYKTQMLIHPDKKIGSHKIVESQINLLINLEYKHLKNSSSDSSKDILKSFENIFLDFKTKYKDLPEFEEFLNNYIFDTISNIGTYLFNSENKNGIPLKRIIEIKNNHLILIGGDMLDRGVTIPNLIVSFMLRDSKTPQADTLIQRARWLGYRENLDFTKVYLTKSLQERYQKLVDHEEVLSLAIRDYSDKNIDMKLLSDLIIVLDEDISPTNPSKARGERTNSFKQWAVQKYFTRNKNFNLENLKFIEKFNKNLDCKKSIEEFGNYWYEITIEDLKVFLKSFKTSEFDKNYNLYLNYMLEKVEKYSNKVDFVIMRKGKYEERSLDLEKEGINNLMQGRGNIENMNMYPGDRKIIKDNPIFQLHMVMLKEDFYLEDNLIYESGSIIPMIAFGIPSNLIVNILDSEKKFISRKNNS